MSRIGDFAIELQGQANELGYETIQEALNDGCEIDSVNQRLITPLEQKINTERSELEKAHKAWLEEKEGILRRLRVMFVSLSSLTTDKAKLEAETISDTIEFIEKGEI